MKLCLVAIVKPVDATHDQDVIVYRREHEVPWGAPPRRGDELEFYPTRFDEKPWEVRNVSWNVEDGSVTLSFDILDARSLSDQPGWEHRQMTSDGWRFSHASIRSEEAVVNMTVA